MSQRGSKQSSSKFGKGLSYNSSLPPFLQRLHAAAGDTSTRAGSGSRHGGRGISGFDDLDEDERPSIVEAGRPGPSGTGRESIPTRPKDGKWAGGSDDEGESKCGKGRAGAAGDDEDEWDQTYGGGGDDGPQIVVLKEGKHLTQAEVDEARESGSGKKRSRDDETQLPDSVKLPSTRASIADKSSSLISSLPSSTKSTPGSIQPPSNPTSTPSNPSKPTNINNTAGAKRKLAELALEKEKKDRARSEGGEESGKPSKMSKKEAVKREKGKKVLLSFGEEEEEG